MSLIGPRPERPEIDKMLIKEIPNYNLRYLVRPGLSGWAQVNYPYGASIKDTKMKFSYDMYYIKNLSTFFDLLKVKHIEFSLPPLPIIPTFMYKYI